MAARKAAPKKEDPSVKWQSLLDGMRSGGAFVFPQEGKTRLRLILPEGEDLYHFYREVINSYGRTKYLIMAVVISSDEPDVVRPVILPKTPLQDILTILAEGYELFDIEEGFGLSITRTGSGLDSKYSVLPSPKAYPLSDDLEWPPEDLDEFADLFAKNAKDRKSKRASGEEAESGPAEVAPERKKRSAEASW